MREATKYSILAVLLFVSGLTAADEKALRLWYRQPARTWTEALPVGNGRLAAMVFGDVRRERLQLNEDTVWSGEKRDRSNPEAPKAVPEIRRLLEQGRVAEAQRMADKTMISIPRALPVYQTLGDLWLEFDNDPDPASYSRELDLDTGIASVRYTANGVRHERQVFVSAPGRCIIVRLTADKPGSISFRATYEPARRCDGRNIAGAPAVDGAGFAQARSGGTRDRRSIPRGTEGRAFRGPSGGRRRSSRRCRGR